MLKSIKSRLAVACASVAVLAGVFAGTALALTENQDRAIDDPIVVATCQASHCTGAWFISSQIASNGNRLMHYQVLVPAGYVCIHFYNDPQGHIVSSGAQAC